MTRSPPPRRPPWPPAGPAGRGGARGPRLVAQIEAGPGDDPGLGGWSGGFANQAHWDPARTRDWRCWAETGRPGRPIAAPRWPPTTCSGCAITTGGRCSRATWPVVMAQPEQVVGGHLGAAMGRPGVGPVCAQHRQSRVRARVPMSLVGESPRPPAETGVVPGAGFNLRATNLGPSARRPAGGAGGWPRGPAPEVASTFDLMRGFRRRTLLKLDSRTSWLTSQSTLTTSWCAFDGSGDGHGLATLAPLAHQRACTWSTWKNDSWRACPDGACPPRGLGAFVIGSRRHEGRREFATVRAGRPGGRPRRRGRGLGQGGRGGPERRPGRRRTGSLLLGRGPGQVGCGPPVEKAGDRHRHRAG